LKKLLVLSGAVACLATSAASAADAPLGPRLVPSAVQVADVSWNGAYFGGHIGGLEGRFRADPIAATFLAGPDALRAPLVDDSTFTTRRGTDLIGGIQTGYRWQAGHLVFGIEQDAAFTDFRRQHTLGEGLGPSTPLFAGSERAGRLWNTSYSSRLSFLSTTRGQIGFAFDRFLVYLSGGLVTGVMDVSAFFPDRGGRGSPAQTFSDKNKFHVGSTFGAGAEYALSHNVSVGFDYRYINLRRERYQLGAGVGPRGNSFTTTGRFDFEGHELLARVNIKTSGLFGLFQ
jgi:outer membrane immunogenic protein